MLSILRKATESLKKSARSNLVEQHDVVEDLSSWEIVKSSLFDDEKDLFSFDGDEPEGKLIEENEEDDDARESRDLVLPDDDVSSELIRHLIYGGGGGDDDDYDEDDVDDDDDVVYYDDMVIGRKMKRCGKGRMKMAKWGVRKVKNSKRLPYYYYNRP